MVCHLKPNFACWSTSSSLSAASGETDAWWKTGGCSIKFRENCLLLALEAGNLIQEELFKLINCLTVNKIPLQISWFNSLSYLERNAVCFLFPLLQTEPHCPRHWLFQTSISAWNGEVTDHFGQTVVLGD